MKLSTKPKPMKGMPLCKQTLTKKKCLKKFQRLFVVCYFNLPINSWLNVGVSTVGGSLKK